MSTDGDSAPRRGEERPEADTARRAATVNKCRDYRVLEREYVTSQISLRELCRRHDISAHSAVVTQARKGLGEEARGLPLPCLRLLHHPSRRPHGSS